MNFVFLRCLMLFVLVTAITSNSVEYISNVGLQQCQRECQYRRFCKSVFYIKSILMCRFRKNGCRYQTKLNNPWKRCIEKADMQKKLLSVCKHNSCDSYHYCVEMKVGYFKCMRTRCHNVIHSHHSYVDEINASVGTKSQGVLKCLSPYNYVSGSDNITCLARGVWEMGNTICLVRQFVSSSSSRNDLSHYTRPTHLIQSSDVPVGSDTRFFESTNYTVSFKLLMRYNKHTYISFFIERKHLDVKDGIDSEAVIVTREDGLNVSDTWKVFPKMNLTFDAVAFDGELPCPFGATLRIEMGFCYRLFEVDAQLVDYNKMTKECQCRHYSNFLKINSKEKGTFYVEYFERHYPWRKAVASYESELTLFHEVFICLGNITSSANATQDLSWDYTPWFPCSLQDIRRHNTIWIVCESAV